MVQVVRRLRQDDVDALLLDELEQRVGKSRVRARWDEMERVAQVAADRPFGHVHADEADLPLAVLAQRPQEPRRSGRAARGDEDRRHACPSTHWKRAGPSGSSNSTTSSRSIANPASRTSREFTSGGKLEKNV